MRPLRRSNARPAFAVLAMVLAGTAACAARAPASPPVAPAASSAPRSAAGDGEGARAGAGASAAARAPALVAAPGGDGGDGGELVMAPERPAPAEPAGPPPPYREPLPPRELPRDAPARRLANLSPAECRAELERRKLPVERDRRPTPGVATATRVVGPIHGVRLILPPRSSPYGVIDCRLALVLGELAQLLAEQGVAAVRIDNVYRPRARLPGTRRPSQHNYALAADVTAFVLADGRTLEIERDWPPARGEPACGPDANLGTDSPEALELRNLVCAIARARLFHHILTPNHDAAHENHLHLDVKRDGPWGTIH